MCLYSGQIPHVITHCRSIVSLYFAAWSMTTRLLTGLFPWRCNALLVACTSSTSHLSLLYLGLLCCYLILVPHHYYQSWSALSLPHLGLICRYLIQVRLVVIWFLSALLHGVGLPCKYLAWVFFNLNWLAPLCRYAIWALLDIIVLTSPASSLLNLGPSCHYEICVLKYVPTS